MRTKIQGTANGQIIVVLAAVVVLLLGFAALAVDGAMLYSDKRDAQNGADAAALAGGGMAALAMENTGVMYDTFTCSNPKVVAAMNAAVNNAITRAADNSYTIDSDISDDNGVEITCGIQDLGPYMEKYIDVKVKITESTDTSFAHLFYSGSTAKTVDSIVRIHPRTNLGYGYAVASMGHDCTTGGVHGNGNTTIRSDHGGVFSNSCFTFTNGGTHVFVNDPGGSGCRYISGTVNPAWCDVPIVQSPVRLVPYTIPAPKCEDLPYNGSFTGHGTFTLDPGRYSTISINGGSIINLNPGLYCISGGLDIGANETINGTSVTLYFTNGAGYSSGATSNVNLSAPTADDPYAIRGMLMYAEEGNTGTFTLYGGAVSNYQGTVYIPDGHIDAHGGGGANAFNSQFIGKMVTLEGSSDINIDFNGALNYQIPAIVDQLK